MWVQQAIELDFPCKNGLVYIGSSCKLSVGQTHLIFSLNETVAFNEHVRRVSTARVKG